MNQTIDTQLQTLAKDCVRNQKKSHHLIDGKLCSICENEVSIEFDEDWDGDEFVILPYCWCDQCQKKVFVRRGKDE